ncbi:glycosyltransferase family 4 protein [Microbacterium sp. Gd 4-13]|uniref:glycosyltransferase family 4 protein n=1 Tax=Microbacterium sp. Gd 4-13 TaxID=2173179 RepID=UPI0014036B37|nr:glycosyltransferase family 4 protein [Microbacterium sp. Gd 4-13]
MTKRARDGQMKVGLLCVGWPGRHEVGGAARYAWRFAEMMRDDVDLHVITSEGGTPLPGATMHFLENGGGRFKHYYRFPFEVRRALRGLDLDILHAFGDDWALTGRRFSWVRTFHGSSLSEARASTGLRRWNHYVLGALEHSVRRRCDLAISVGPEGESEFKTDILIPPVIPRDGDFTPPEPSTKPTVTFIGTATGRKRGLMAASLVNEASRRTGLAIELRVVGPANDKKNWPAGVMHYSDPQDEEVTALIRESWLLIAPSAYEGFGIPAFEAASLGVPSVSSPNPGSEYIAQQIGNDELFAVRDDATFIDALVDRLTRGAPSQSSSIRAAVDAADALASQASKSRILELYSSLRTGRR